MKAFKVDSRGDLIISGGNLILLEGREELVQSMERILSTNMGEWFLDLDFGLDYPSIWGKGKDQEVISTKITEALLENEERLASVEIDKISISPGRRLVVYGRAIDSYGEIIDLTKLNLEGVIDFE